MKIILVIIGFFLLNQCNSDSSNVNIKFKVTAETLPDNSEIYITGNHDLLGNWIPNKIKLKNQYFKLAELETYPKPFHIFR